jgi:hypothetical protein
MREDKPKLHDFLLQFNPMSSRPVRVVKELPVRDSSVLTAEKKTAFSLA